MNKAGKHIQSCASANNGKNLKSPTSNTTAITPSIPPPSGPSQTTKSPLLGGNNANVGIQTQKNVINSIMSFLPDNRPITSLQIVEDYERCPKNFTPVHRTYDQDADADLWRENNILFGRQTTRYLCLSKTEGLPDYVVETLKVIAEKVQPPKEFSLLSRTADTEQKAWRKRQIAYKLSKRGTVTQAVTDIILCSKLKIAPDGFKLAGDINGVLICYKTGTIPVRLPPPIPGVPSQQLQNNNTSNNTSASEIEKALNRLNLNRYGKELPPLPPKPNDHDYEEIQSQFQINSPQRPAPPLPSSNSNVKLNSCHSVGTLGAYSELDGVPFIMNPALTQLSQNDISTLPEITNRLQQLDYDFHLERQILCTMKSSASKNPFFK